MTLNTLRAYRNTRLTGEDWNTCGQAAIATILDFHGIDPFGLPRTGGFWNDGEIIDALIADGMGPDVIFGWGTDPGRVEEALRKYGLDASAVYSNPLQPRSRSALFADLAAFLDQDLPVPVLVDLGILGGPDFGVHWPVAYKVENDRVYLAAMSGWNSTPTIAQFISAWHVWFLPFGFNWAAVYAKRIAAESWSQKDAGTLKTADRPDEITYTVEHNAIPAHSVEFKLALSGNVTWKKTLNLPDGLGNSWDIVAEGANAEASNGLWANQVQNGQALTFIKSKFFGHQAPVLVLGDLEYLEGGDRVTFTWVRD